MEAAVREILAGPTQHTTTAPNFLISHSRGRHLSYLIGQQRSQSSPLAVSKSSANIRHRHPQKGTESYDVLICLGLFVAPAPAPAPVALMTLG
jgi:hypothetical protein